MKAGREERIALTKNVDTLKDNTSRGSEREIEATFEQRTHEKKKKKPGSMEMNTVPLTSPDPSLVRKEGR